VISSALRLGTACNYDRLNGAPVDEQVLHVSLAGLHKGIPRPGDEHDHWRTAHPLKETTHPLKEVTVLTVSPSVRSLFVLRRSWSLWRFCAAANIFNYRLQPRNTCLYIKIR